MKINTYFSITKATKGKGLESNLHKSFQDNFLTKELKVIEENWGFNLESIIEEYMKTYKGKNLIPKGALKELLQSRIELRLTTPTIFALTFILFVT